MNQFMVLESQNQNRLSPRRESRLTRAACRCPRSSNPRGPSQSLELHHLKQTSEILCQEESPSSKQARLLNIERRLYHQAKKSEAKNGGRQK